jgi:hypothetical protein
VPDHVRAAAALHRGFGNLETFLVVANPDCVASPKSLALGDQGRVAFLEGTNVNPRGAVFQPELIELMQSVLEDATATLPESKRTSAIKAEMASNILAGAAKGERSPVVLKMRALLTVVDVSHYSHDISPERRAV